MTDELKDALHIAVLFQKMNKWMSMFDIGMINIKKNIYSIPNFSVRS